ncbi:MAG TPA: zf-HC2 domain-containing protein [Rhizomicrobium sp.]|nr:zf-HC2 domain-containing protein [Rhizomicrobium sp.]
MSCEQSLITQSYLDGELRDEQAQAAERHLENCLACQEQAANTADLSDALRKLARYPAPELLRHKLTKQLDLETRRSPAGIFWMGAASGGGFSALAAGFALFLLLPPSAATLSQSVVEAHTAALTGGKTIMVASSNHHTVKPWLAAHAGISPPVVDFADQGFALTGGRTDEVAGRRAAVAVYAHGKHEVDLFTWPDRGAALPEPGMARGFRTAFWKAGDLDYAAVSDMDAAAFQKFVALAKTRRE